MQKVDCGRLYSWMLWPLVKYTSCPCCSKTTEDVVHVLHNGTLSLEEPLPHCVAVDLHKRKAELTWQCLSYKKVDWEMGYPLCCGGLIMGLSYGQMCKRLLKLHSTKPVWHKNDFQRWHCFVDDVTSQSKRLFAGTSLTEVCSTYRTTGGINGTYS